jgi:hypothetical protein
LHNNALGGFSSAKDRLIANQAAFSLDSASYITASCVVSATGQRRSWNKQKGSEACSKGKMGTFPIGFGILQAL